MGLRSERRLCQEVHLNLAYRWFCRLGLEDKVPDHSSFSKLRHGKFRDSEIFRRVFERVVAQCIVRGKGFAVDASLISADVQNQSSSRQDRWDVRLRRKREERVLHEGEVRATCLTPSDGTGAASSGSDADANGSCYSGAAGGWLERPNTRVGGRCPPSRFRPLRSCGLGRLPAEPRLRPAGERFRGRDPHCGQ